MKVSEYKQMMAYLTRPGTKKENLKQIIKKSKPDNSPYMVSNGEIMTENEFKKSLPVEDQPGYNPDKDPNLLRRIKYYQGESLGADFDRAIEEEDKALKKLGRDPANILQRNRKVDPLVPKRATTKQMVELKGKIDKYKDVHFPKEEKPFTKIANNLGKKKITKPLEPIKLDFSPLPNKMYKPEPPNPEMQRLERQFNEMVRKDQEEKIKNATSGLAGIIEGRNIFKD